LDPDSGTPGSGSETLPEVQSRKEKLTRFYSMNALYFLISLMQNTIESWSVMKTLQINSQPTTYSKHL